MPGKIKVKVVAGRNLPVMDRAGDTTDAFVEIKFGSVTHKTDVCRKSLNPHWNSTEWYRFEVDESEMQDEPLQLRLMDHDTYSANDAIGKVVISLAPLLAREANAKATTVPSGGAVLSGWIPVFDTMHGIRGELNVIVKVELFSDFNKYKTSSCGVQFFHCPTIPPGYTATAIHGFVEELVVNDDPEYQWIDKIRTPRASNEARQVAFIKLSNQVQRLVGLKAAELGANAVVGYQQDFDLEGEAGVVARAIGTAVSITPPPTPNQSISIPPCTQQELRKCLDILATDNESITDLNQYFQNHQDELHRLLNILNPKTPSLLDEPDIVEEDEKDVLTRQSSIKSYTGSLSIYQDDFISQKSLKHISEDQTDLNRLLKQNDDSDSDSGGPLQKIKKLKTTFFSKRFGNVRTRKSDKQDDQVSLKSNSSDNSRISLTDFRNEFKKFKRLKKPKFRKVFVNQEDEGIGMASILARSVIHAHTSLACIAESQDSEHSPSSTMRRTSESEPTINVSDDDKPKKTTTDITEENKNKESKAKVPEIHTSLKNISTDDGSGSAIERTRKLSESCPSTPMVERNEHLLKLPGEAGYYGSISLSGESSEVYSSSEEDDESSDQKTDTEKSVETTSSVVHSVLNKGVNPVIIAQMDRKLSIMESNASELKESKSHNDIEEREEKYAKLESSKSSPCIREECEVKNETNIEAIVKTATSLNKDVNTSADPKQDSNHYFKFHNPFSHRKVSKSISVPSSPVENKGFMYRSSRRIRQQLIKFTNSNMMKSLSHYSLLPKKRHAEVKVTLSQPGSSSDVQSKAPSETVLGSPFLSYADLLALDKEVSDIHKLNLFRNDEQEYSRVKMYIGSEPISRASMSGPSQCSKYESQDFESHKSFRKERADSLKPTGLVQTAMETILIDKVQSLLVTTSPDSSQSKEQQFFDDVNQKLEKVEEAQNLADLKKYQHDIKTNSTRCSRDNIKNEGLFHTAMETILMDKVQSLLTPCTSGVNDGKENKFFPEFRQETDTHDSERIAFDEHKHDQLKTDSRDRSRSREKQDKNDSLFNTAMKTILIDKVQALIPPTSEPIDVSEHITSECSQQSHTKDDETTHSRRSSKHQGGLLHTAMETILIDKVQTLIPPTSEPVTPIEQTPTIPQHQATDKHKENDDRKHCSLLHSAMETMLLDKAQDLLPTNAEHYKSESDTQIFEPRTEQKIEVKENQNTNLLLTAMETKLLDKVQAFIPPNSEIIHPVNSVCNDEVVTEEKTDKTKEHSPSLFHTALETTVLDKAQTLIQTSEIDGRDKSIHTAAEEQPIASIKFEISTSNCKSALAINDTKDKKLVRQDSVHSIQEGNDESKKMSKNVDVNITVPSIVTHSKPMLQHFHPILSGPTLETIPSLPESSFDHAESLDVEGVERTCDCQPGRKCDVCDSEINSVSVCDNSHAACRFDRNEREKEKDKCEKEMGSPRHARHESYGGREPVLTLQPMLNSSLNSSSTPMGIHRRSSDSDLSVTPKGGSLNASIGNTGSGGGAILRPSMNSNNLEMLEYPFLTMTEYPPGFIVHIGGTVCARSVKLVDAGGESAARAAWWAELRTELRAHARALRCNAVIAYTESAAICEDVCVLSASGTAAVINLDCDFDMLAAANAVSKSSEDEPEQEWCSIAHVPYSPGAGPYRVELSTCGGCRRARVPAVLLATCAKPNKLHSYARAVTLTAVAARVRRAPPAAEPGARDISDQLPFLEYELHKLLIAKLRMQGANALFALQTQIAIGERCVMAIATGTAVRLAALPPPTPPRIKASENDKDALEIQRALWDSFTANKAANGYDIGGSADQISNGVLPELEGDEAPALDLCSDKDACVLELDEAEDVETAKSLATRRMHMQVFSSSLKAAPMSPPHAFAQVWRARLPASGGGAAAAERHVSRALDTVSYKLRRLQPCALTAPRFHLELPEDEIQLVVSGAAIPLVDPNKPEHNLAERSHSQSSSPQLSHGNGNHGNSSGDVDDDIFTLDEEQLVKRPPSEVGDVLNGQVPTMVSMTTLSYVSGSRAMRRICALRLLFVRETTAVRELGGLSGFLHTFTCEVLAIVRCYTAALGGNALTSFYITQLMLQDNAHKNQGQCLLSVGGDVVHITY